MLRTRVINGQTGTFLGDGLDAAVYRFESNPCETDANVICAVKCFHEESFDEFEKEMQMLTLCRSANVVAMLGAHEESHSIVLEFGHNELGIALRKCRRECEVLDMDSVVRPAIRDVLRALSHIHSLGIIHRDVKPHNIIQVGEVFKLIDFATAAHSEPLFMRTGGTYLYDAPEKLIRMPFGASSDIWSVGVTAFELATSSVVFDAHNFSCFNYGGGKEEELSDIGSDESTDYKSSESCKSHSSTRSSLASHNTGHSSSECCESNDSNNSDDSEDEGRIIYHLLFLQQKLLGPPPRAFTDFAQEYYNNDGRLRNSPQMTYISRDYFIKENFFCAELGEVEIAQNRKIVSDEFVDFVFSMFTFDAEARPSAAALLQHGWIV